MVNEHSCSVREGDPSLIVSSKLILSGRLNVRTSPESLSTLSFLFFSPSASVNHSDSTS